LQQNLQQVAPNQEKPHTTPLHYLIYSIYISVITRHRNASSLLTGPAATEWSAAYCSWLAKPGTKIIIAQCAGCQPDNSAFR
jgi:hypothetical protein